MAVCPPKGLSRTSDGVQRASIVHGETLEKAYGVGTNARRREVKTGEGVAVAWTVPSGAGEFHLPVSVCKESHLLVAFQGALSNRAVLHAHLGVPEGTTMSDAKLLALLALEHPDKPHTVVAKLRGTFSFVVVDTASVRLFASRDPSGTIPLNLYHHADGAVVVTNYANTPEQVNATLEAPLKVENMQEIEVGTLVFGHHAIQRGHVQKFAPAADSMEKSKAAAAAAAAAALSGLRDVKPQQVTFEQLQEASRRKSRELARKPKPVVVDYSTAVAMAASPHLDWVPVAATPTPQPRKLSPVDKTQKQRCLESSWWRKEPHPNPAYVPPQRRSLDVNAQASNALKRVESVSEGTTVDSWVEMKPTPMAPQHVEYTQRTSLDLNADMMARVMVMKEQSQQSPFETEGEKEPETEARTSLDMNADMMKHVMQAQKKPSHQEKIEEAVSALHEVASQLTVEEWMERAEDFEGFENVFDGIASSPTKSVLSAARAQHARLALITPATTFKACRSLLSAVSSATGSCANLQALV